MTQIAQPPGPPPAKNMVWIPGGTYRLGSDDFYPEERPVYHVSVDGFWMDQYTVTVDEFRRFVKATGYVTVAERPLDPADYPDADPALLVPGALVFQKRQGRWT
jgi:formylglycine-generating enzyme required for sulfatase activity